MKKKCFNAGIAAIIISGSMLTAHANPDNPTTNSPKDPATHNKPAYGDNPSIGRVLLYKTGQGIQNVGDAIQRSSENVSQRIKHSLNDGDTPTDATVTTVTSTSQSNMTNTPTATASTSNAVPTTPPSNMANQGEIPLVQGRLSQSSTGYVPRLSPDTSTSNAQPSNTPSRIAPSSSATSYGIGTE